MNHSPAELLVGLLFFVCVPVGAIIVAFIASRTGMIAEDAAIEAPVRYVFAGFFVAVGSRDLLGLDPGFGPWILVGGLAAALIGVAYALAAVVTQRATGLFAYNDGADPGQWLQPGGAGASRLLVLDGGNAVRVGRRGATNDRSVAAVLAVLFMFFMEIAASFGLAVWGLAVADFSFETAFDLFISVWIVLLSVGIVLLSIFVGLPMTRHNLWRFAPGGMLSLLSYLGTPAELVAVSKPEIDTDQAKNIDGPETSRRLNDNPLDSV
jgi:hypothetical protein